MARLACLLLLTLLLACGGNAAGRATFVPSVEPRGAPLPAPNAAPTREAPPGETRPAEIQEEGDAPGSGAVGPSRAALVRIREGDFAVELAVTPAQRVQGLSGRTALAPGSGMLFIYEQESKYAFWMKEMRFPLDLVWVGDGCTVVDVTRNAPPPAPGQALAELPRYVPAAAARYVLEINAGEADAAGLGPGDPVAFTGSLAGLYGC